MKLNNNPDIQISSLQEAKNKKISVKNSKKTSQLLFIFVGSFCLFLLANQAIWAQIESIYNSATDEVAGISGLMSAVTNNDIEGVKFFSKGGPLIINQKNLGGATALHIACRESNTEAVKILIENGASVNIADNEGWTPLMRASLAGNAQIVEMLIVKNAKVDAFNSIGETALVHATSSRCLDCLNIIIEKGNLVKTANLKTLKTQITDAFLLARNQEESSIKTVLEAFLDYVNKADNLLTTQITEAKPSDSLPEPSSESSKNEPVKKLTVNKKTGKKFALKTTQEQQQEEPEVVVKSASIKNKTIEAPKIIQPNEKPAKDNPINANPIKQAKLEPVEKPVSQVVKPAKISEKPKKSFKLKKPAEDAKNKIPTFTQQSLPPVVASVNQELVVVENSSNNDKPENLQNNNLLNENKPKEIIPAIEVLSEAKPGFFKKFLLKKSPAKSAENVQNQALQNEQLKTQSLPKNAPELEKSPEVLQNSPEKLSDIQPVAVKDATDDSQKQKLEFKQQSIESKQIKPETKQDQDKLPQVVKSVDDNSPQNSENKNSSTKDQSQNQVKSQEKLKKFKFSPVQDAKNKPASVQEVSQPLSQNDTSKNDVSQTPPSSSNIKKSNETELPKRKYKLKAITDIENTDSEVEIKKLPVPQEI